MNKNEFDDYLVRGWECGANIFYHGRIYFSQCAYDIAKNNYCFSVFSFKAERHKEHSFSPYMRKGGGYVGEMDHIDQFFETRETAKEYYLSSKIFEGKSFWEIGKNLQWLEDDGPAIFVD